MSNPILLTDFDGVVHSYISGWKGVEIIPDLPVPGAFQWIKEHLPPITSNVCSNCNWKVGIYRGLEVQIYSTRSRYKEGLDAMISWFIKHGMQKEYFTMDVLKLPAKKPAAFLTIDDRAICFNGIFPTDQEMWSFKPWYKK